MMFKQCFQSILHRSHVTRTLISSVVISSLLVFSPLSSANQDTSELNDDDRPRLAVSYTHLTLPTSVLV